jgi:transcription antitermination factor NusG
MQSDVQYEEMKWFAMRVTYHRELEAKRLLDEKGVENFIPMKYEKSARTGKKRLVPVIHNIIFVHTTAPRIQELKNPSCIPILQYMMDNRLGKKITVPENQMKQFIAVTGTYDESLRFFGPSEIHFTKAQKVRITGGTFEGCEGVFVKVQGSRSKKVVIEIQGIVAVALVSVHPELVVPIGE